MSNFTIDELNEISNGVKRDQEKYGKEKMRKAIKNGEMNFSINDIKLDDSFNVRSRTNQLLDINFTREIPNTLYIVAHLITDPNSKELIDE